MEQLIAVLLTIFGSIIVVLLSLLVASVNKRFDEFNIRLANVEKKVNCTDQKLDGVVNLIIAMLSASSEKIKEVMAVVNTKFGG
jgi:sensor domain CHASE-containing protein